MSATAGAIVPASSGSPSDTPNTSPDGSPKKQEITRVRTQVLPDGRLLVFKRREIRYPNGDRYVGETVDDTRYGQGSLYMRNGDVYVGGWQEGVYHGVGVLTSAATVAEDNTSVFGETYQGDWVLGRRHGRGVHKTSAGDVYDGDFANDRYEGKGLRTRADGEKYTGDWHLGQYHGHGNLILGNRDTFDGTFQMGQFHGDGVYRYSTGGHYTGGFKFNLRHGIGRRVWATGAEYEGEWQDGLMHGRGIYKSPMGDVYVGEFSEGKFHGEGTLMFHNGDRYQGQLEHGVPSGKGRYSYATGGYYEGEYGAQLRCGVAHSKRALRIIHVATKVRMHGGAVDRKIDPWTYAMQAYFGQRALNAYDSDIPMVRSGRIFSGSLDDERWLQGDRTTRAKARSVPAYDGKRHGKGVRVWSTGAQYEGEWLQDEMHGQGEYSDPSGRRYVGKWRFGKPNGLGRAEFTNGGEPYTCPLRYRHDGVGTCVYTGEWRAGEMHGHGVFQCCDGRMYEGMWANGKKHGRGKLVEIPAAAVEAIRVRSSVDALGRRWMLAFWAPAEYEGEFDQDERHGKAHITMVNGDIFEGTIVHGKWEGVVRINLA